MIGRLSWIVLGTLVESQGPARERSKRLESEADVTVLAAEVGGCRCCI